MTRTSRIRGLTAAGAVAALAVAATAASASAVTLKTSVRASVKVTERQDWQVVKPTSHGCAAVGTGHEVMTAQGGPKRVVLSEEKADSHAPFTAALSVPARFKFELADDTTRTPPETEDGSCGTDPKDCGVFAAGTHRVAMGSRANHARAEITPIYPPDRQNCFTSPRQFPWYVSRAVAVWKTKGFAAGKPGAHTVRVTRHFKPELVRDTDYGDISVTGTVTVELVYRRVGRTRLTG